MSWDQYPPGAGEPPADQPQWVTPGDPPAYGQDPPQPGQAPLGQTARYPEPFAGGDGVQYPGQPYPTEQFGAQQYPGQAPEGQAFPGQQPYPTQQLPQDAYAQGPYGPGAVGQAPYGGWPGYPPQPPKKSRLGVIIGGAVGAVAVVVAVALIVANSGSSGGTPTADGTPTAPANTAAAGGGQSSSPAPTQSVAQEATSFTLPQSAGPLTLLDNSDVQQRTNTMQQQLQGNADYPDPAIGFYGLNGADDYTVWMQAQETDDTPDISDAVQSLGAAAVVNEIAQGAKMRDASTRSPGALGGAVECGHLVVSDTTVNSCFWVDGVSFGALYASDSTSLADVYTYEQDLRRAAELGS